MDILEYWKSQNGIANRSKIVMILQKIVSGKRSSDRMNWIIRIERIVGLTIFERLYCVVQLNVEVSSCTLAIGLSNSNNPFSKSLNASSASISTRTNSGMIRVSD